MPRDIWEGDWLREREAKMVELKAELSESLDFLIQVEVNLVCCHLLPLLFYAIALECNCNCVFREWVIVVPQTGDCDCVFTSGDCDAVVTKERL